MKGSKLQKEILNLLSAHGYYAVNVVVASRNGTSDILACIEGKFASIEVKGAGDIASELQRAKHRRVEAAKGHAIFAYSLQDVKDLIVTLQD